MKTTSKLSFSLEDSTLSSQSIIAANWRTCSKIEVVISKTSIRERVRLIEFFSLDEWMFQIGIGRRTHTDDTHLLYILFSQNTTCRPHAYSKYAWCLVCEHLVESSSRNSNAIVFWDIEHFHHGKKRRVALCFSSMYLPSKTHAFRQACIFVEPRDIFPFVHAFYPSRMTFFTQKRLFRISALPSSRFAVELLTDWIPSKQIKYY